MPTSPYPWSSAYPDDIRYDSAFDGIAVAQLLWDAVPQYGERPCVDFLGKRFSYREIGDLVARCARGLQDLGVGKGTKVGLFLPNTPYSVICYYAVLTAGGTVVNYNPLYAEREVCTQIEDSQTTLMITLDLELLYRKLMHAIEHTCLERLVVCRMQDILPTTKSLLFRLFRRGDVANIDADDPVVRYHSLVDNGGAYDPVDIDPDRDIAVLQYTGGTTGVPKAAMLSHTNLTANTRQIAAWFPTRELGNERVIGVLPFFHVFAMTVVMNFSVHGGAEMILLPRFDVRQLLDIAQKKRPTMFPGVPTVYTQINNYPKIDNYDLTSIKYCISGGAALPVEVKQRFERLTGCALVEGYGLSETSPVATCNPLKGENKSGSIGLPLPATKLEIRDLDDPTQTVADGERGEICIFGPQRMLGYWQRAEETDAAIVDGWLRTGDIGYMDRDGYTFLVDRAKDLIICNGYNIYPRVIEEAIYLCDAVAECTVCGVPDERRGEAPKAFVKLKDGATLSAEQLLEFLADKLSPNEIPRSVEFRDELPKTMIGKLSKKELVAEEKQKAAGSAQRA